MILRILLVTCAVLLPPSFAIMDIGKFSKNFENECFQNDDNEPFRVNGQDLPLSNTMENFIAMAEKFEIANPNVDLKDELIYFISEYLFENIKITGGKVSQRTVERVNLKTVESLWDPDLNVGYRPDFADPFSPSDKCSIYFMISHSIMEKDTSLLQRSYGNYNYTDVRRIDPDAYFPQEIGVVSVRGSIGPVSLSKVLLGLHVGLKGNRKTELRSHVLHFEGISQQEKLDQTVDALYTSTLSEVLMLSSWDGFERVGMTKNGEWVSIPLSNGEEIQGFCPMVYSHRSAGNNKMLPAYSFASVRGAADGLILGLTVNQVYSSDVKLSQILRSYYSPRGIVVNANIEDINERKVSFCNRNALMKTLDAKVKEQMVMYGYLIAIAERDIDKSYQRAVSQYEDNKNEINFENRANDFCMQPTSLEKPEDLAAETSLDIIVVMDSSNSEKNFIDQQLITGYLAKELDLKYFGSRMTILLDRKNDTLNSATGTSSKIVLQPVVNGTFSSSCAACRVGEISYTNIQELTTFARENVIIAIDQLLQEMKDNETAFNGVNGKVVIYFNYENGDGRPNNNKVQGNVERALRNFNLRHPEVLLYAVGLDPELLKKYARNDPSLIFLGTDDKPQEVADKILKKISYAPALLQYTDCDEAKNEKSSYFENFVSPSKVQHYTMPAEYFYKSYHAKVLFESQNGQVRICYSRATMKPENEAKSCKDTVAGAITEFKLNNPCKGFTKDSCSPMYFAVMGIDPTAPETNGNQAQRQKTPCKITDRWCSSLDQIKFKVSHEGIRCSGCLGLGAPPTIILFTVLLTYFLYRRF